MTYKVKKFGRVYYLYKNGRYHAESKSKRDILSYIKLHPLRKSKRKNPYKIF